MKYLLPGQETERLTLRLLFNEDFKEWIHLFGHKDVATYLALDPKLSKKELCQKWFDKVYHRYENDLGGMNVLIDKKSNKLVGQCGLLIQTVEDEKRLEVGYAILPEFWHQGYASEAAQKCRDYAFENNFSDDLISIVHKDNVGSQKVAIKNGMLIEKSIDSFMGMPVDIFKIDKTDWSKYL